MSKNNVNLTEMYELVVAKLKMAKIPCQVKELEDEIVIEFGFDWPDELIDKCSDVGIETSAILAMCAEQFGGKLIQSVRIAGGPKNYMFGGIK